jgi:hypothetical protein
VWHEYHRCVRKADERQEKLTPRQENLTLARKGIRMAKRGLGGKLYLRRNMKTCGGFQVRKVDPVPALALSGLIRR